MLQVQNRTNSDMHADSLWALALGLPVMALQHYRKLRKPWNDSFGSCHYGPGRICVAGINHPTRCPENRSRGESLDFQPRRLLPAGLVALWPLPDGAGVEYQPSTPALPVCSAGSVPWPCNHQPTRGVALNASGAKTQKTARIVKPIFWGENRIIVRLALAG